MSCFWGVVGGGWGGGGGGVLGTFKNGWTTYGGGGELL